jgi:hypothetical protein
MSKYDQYNGIARELEILIKSNKNVFSLIDEANKMSRQFDFLKMIEPLQEEMDRIISFKKIMSQSILDSPISKIAREANLAISDLLKSLQYVILKEEMPNIKNLWEREIPSITSFNKSIEGTFLSMQSELARISEISLFAEKTLAQIDFDKIGSLLGPLPEIKDMLADSLYSFSESYSSLFKSFSKPIFSYPPVFITMPPKEYYFGTRILEVITLPQEHIEEEEILYQKLSKEAVDEIEFYLSLIDPSLIKLWRGAKEASTSTNPDAGRHFAVSLRELLMHVIHILAPDDPIKQWSISPQFYDEKGLPTRKARLLYICKEIKHEPFDNFLLKDIDAALACMDVFQKGTHSIDPSFAGTQIDLLISRVATVIIFLIRTYKETGKPN